MQKAAIIASAGEKKIAKTEEVISFPSTRALFLLTLIPANAATNSVPGGTGVAVNPINPGIFPEKKTRVITMAIRTAKTDWELISNSESAISHFRWLTLLLKIR